MESARSSIASSARAPSESVQSTLGGRSKGSDGPGPPPPPAGKPKDSLEQTSLWKCLQGEAWDDLKVEIKKLGEAKINLTDESFGWTPGHFAANAGNCGALKVILDAKAKIDPPDNEGNTMLMLACRKGHLQAAEFLIGRKADMNAQSKNGWTALMWVAINGHEDVTSLLLNASADHLRTDVEGRTACMWAARHGHLDIVETFLACGLNLSVQDQAGFTVLDHCQDHLDMAAVVSAVHEINTHLQHAAQRNDSEAVREAIEAGADVDLRDGDGWTPLMWAALHGSLDMVQLIIRYGARPSLLDDTGHVLEHLQTHHLAVGEAIEEILGANDRLLAAAMENNWEKAAEELAVGAFINVRDNCQRTSLMWAAKHCSAEGVHMLLNKSAFVNDRDAFGWAAVHYAVSEKSPETVSMFHYLGADFAIKTYEGDGLLHMAVRADDGVLIQLMLAAGLSTEDVDYHHFTPLMMAAYHGLENAVEALLAYSADLDARSTEEHGKRTAFGLAVVHGHQGVVATMLQPLQAPPKLPGEVEKVDAVPKTPMKVKPNFAKVAAAAAAADSLSQTAPPSVGGAAALLGATGGGGGGAAGGGGGMARTLSGKKLTSLVTLASSKLAVPTPSPMPAHSPVAAKTKATAGGVAARRRAAPKAKVDVRGDSPNALIEEAIRKRGEQLWSTLPSPARVIRQVDGHGASPLALAVRYRQTAIGTQLLQAQADPNAADDHGTTVLMEAVLSRQREVVELMLDLGARVDSKNKEGKTAADLCDDEVILRMLHRAMALSHVPRTEAEVLEHARLLEERLAERNAKLAATFRVRLENLPRNITAANLENHVRMVMYRCGAANPQRVQVELDPITGMPLGVAYAEFPDAVALDLAMHGDGDDVLGHRIRIHKEPRIPH